MDTTTLFLAIALILVVMAIAFHVAGRGRRDQPYWGTWTVANLVLAAALTAYVFLDDLPRFFMATVPNGLLVLGFGMRWLAARQFGGRDTRNWMVWGPCALFVGLCAIPAVAGSYSAVYTIVNVILCATAFATAAEFWRDRADRLPSRIGLVSAYGIMGASFAVRVGQGLFAAGDIVRYLPEDTLLEIHLVVGVLHVVGAGAFALSLAYERGNLELRHAADHDALTGLLNRGAFEARLRRRLEHGCGNFALAVFDVDHFKGINDTYGHAAGDEALRTCAQVCRSIVRDGDMVARIGGEEFAVLLDGLSANEARATVERIRRTMKATIISAGERRFRISISAGIHHVGAGSPGLRHLDAYCR